MDFYRRLSDSNSPWVFRTLLCKLAHFTRAVIWILSIFPLTSNTLNLFSQFYWTIPRLPSENRSLLPSYSLPLSSFC